MGILGIFVLWGMYNPTVSSIQNNKWTIRSVIAAAEKGDIISGTIQGLPSKGFEWYKLYGEARKTEGNVSADDSTEQVIINAGNFLQNLIIPFRKTKQGNHMKLKFGLYYGGRSLDAEQP
jgi:hypothetical protein